MRKKYASHLLALSVLFFSLSQITLAQKAQISGRVADSSGAVVVGANVIVANVDTGIVRTIASNEEGYYAVTLLEPGNYRISVEMQGFKKVERSGIKLEVNQLARVNFALEVGEVTTKLDVTADASLLNYENAEQKGGVSPDTVTELPLLVAGGPRAAPAFVMLLPGVTAAAGDVFSVHMNGSQQSGGESLLNGVSMVSPSGAGGIWSPAFDYVQSPDMVSELKVLTANYEPQYGSAAGSVIIMETKSGTAKFHGSLYEYHRNTVLNARQFGAGSRPKDIENNFGGSVGGPVQLPLAWSKRNKTYFFFNFEGFRIRGGAVRPTLSIPSLKERAGDFTDWLDASGNLIPIFDPATTRTVNGQVVRDQFMGCDGRTPNVICPNRIQNSLAKEWFKHLPDPTSAGPLNNYLAPAIPGAYITDANFYNLRVDEYLGDKDRFSVTMYYRPGVRQGPTTLPPPISTDFDQWQYSWMNRLSWDHTFSPTLINHFSGGYNNLNWFGGSVAAPYADQLPKIKGVGSHEYPPYVRFSNGFTGYGARQGKPEDNNWPAPAYVFNDLVTWVKGKHTFKFGAEYRNAATTVHTSAGEAGRFNFNRLQTGLLNINSGNPIASFLLEQVDSSTLEVRPFEVASGRWDAWMAHVGDTWKLTPKLSLQLGIRWDMHRPTAEKYDVFSFLDPLGPNPDAGGRPGRLTFAGTDWGPASFGKRRPEETFTTGFAPRVGIAYSPTPSMVVRTGYGIFYDAGQYPGVRGGIANDGFNANQTFGSSLGGLAPAFILSEGFPQDFQRPPFISPGFLNGQAGPLYRPSDGNRLPYAQQWNLSLERELGGGFFVSAAYVGSKGTRLMSRVAPLNALDPRLLSMGPRLYDQFQPGQTILNGVPLPYAGWTQQMRTCAPSVAQALLPFPQYCGGLTGVNENAGNSTFHSFQAKVEKRLSGGLWLLGSYTFAKLLTDSDNVQPTTYEGNPSGLFSPFERHRAKSLAAQDVPQTLVLSLIYDLPFGKGKPWLSNGGVLDKIVGGWRVSNVFRANSGTPFVFRSGNCNVPAQFRVGCVPAIGPGANPFSQSKDNFDPTKPLLSVAAFEPVNSFNFYSGQGDRVSNVRGFGYDNHDFALLKSFQIKEEISFQVRAEFFNVWNWHVFRGFTTDLANPTFGMWNGAVTAPRNIQVGARVTF